MSIFVGPHVTLEQIQQMRRQMQAQMAAQERVNVQNVDYNWSPHGPVTDLVEVDGVWQLPWTK